MGFKDKSPAMQTFLDAQAMDFYGRSVSESLDKGICVRCGQAAVTFGFRDELSATEYGISGLCQACQAVFESLIEVPLRRS